MPEPQRRKRLCMLVHGPYPIGEERVLREARAAQAHGWEVDVVALRKPGEPRRETIDGCHIFRLPLTTLPRTALQVPIEYLGFLLLSTGWLVRSLIRPYDVVQVHNPPDFLLAAAMIPRLSGACLVFDVHDFAPELFDLHFEGAPAVVRRMLTRVERWAFRTADAVVTVNQRYADRIATIRGAETHVVLNSLDEGLLPDSEASSDRGFRVVTHGTLNIHYGVDVLLEAFRVVKDTVSDAKLEIYGDGDAVELIGRRIRELGLDDDVVFDGRYLPQREALRLVTGAHVGVVANLGLPRNHAALPVKLLEYVAMGIPVVTSDLDAIHDYFSEDELVFVPPGDSTALAAALVDVATKPEEAGARAGRASARYAAYRWDAQAAGYLALLDSLAKNHAAKR
jgi:glycosyltransferase involved in cell wall biosynthesis